MSYTYSVCGISESDLQVTQLLYKLLHIYKIYKIYTLKH